MDNSSKPLLQIGEIGFLEVNDVKEFGAFLEWEPGNDLLLPKKEQIGRLQPRDSILIGVKMNEETDLPFATMKLYSLLSTDSEYRKNDVAKGTVYSINPEFGVFVAVDNRYHGLLLNKEVYDSYKIGDQVEVRIKNVREDGKLELSTRKQAFNEIEEDAKKILKRLKANDGKLLLNDNSSPEIIKKEFNISKKAFKRAVGRLLKEGAVEITDDGMVLRWPTE